MLPLEAPAISAYLQEHQDKEYTGAPVCMHGGVSERTSE